MPLLQLLMLMANSQSFPFLFFFYFIYVFFEGKQPKRVDSANVCQEKGFMCYLKIDFQ